MESTEKKMLQLINQNSELSERYKRALERCK